MAGVEWGFLLLDLGAEWMGEGDDAGTMGIYTEFRFEVPQTFAHACRFCGHESVDFVKHVVM